LLILNESEMKPQVHIAITNMTGAVVVVITL